LIFALEEVEKDKVIEDEEEKYEEAKRRKI
jgi:hypothetical protein